MKPEDLTIKKEPEIEIPTPPKQQQEISEEDKEFLMIANEKTGLKIHLISQTCSMTDLINYAFNIQANFFNKDNKDKGSYLG